ncbi:hypothetical protein NUW54_g6446 [Trametes sanguinea]|uniref:Uncharacterized protein n=1 Tax=Trametes sanguinea TaxID=158606 RepID=A0ACC1PUZ1_9APHY|nr:hypothetical protein NUW54_g6446 [Trametes sanguinea]
MLRPSSRSADEPPSPKRRSLEASAASTRGTLGVAKRKAVVPRLHFTRVSPFLSTPGFCVAGFGNTVGLFRFHCEHDRGTGALAGSPTKRTKEGRHGPAKAE